MSLEPTRSSRSLLQWSVLVVVFSVPLAISSFLSTGCSPKTTGVGAATATATGTTTSTVAGTTVIPTSTATSTATAVPTSTGIAWPMPTGSEIPMTTTSVTASAAPPPPCWKGFAPTGNAGADVLELGRRCAGGMTLLPGMPVKHTLSAGTRKSIPLPLVIAGCYRVIAVGGTGTKDVDLELYDGSGKLVAADRTPDDIMPMIHPNKELCIDATSFNMRIDLVMKKGSGEVAGAVWKK